MNRTLAKKALAYLLGGLILAGILILWRFPYESLQHRLEAAARERLGLRLELADLSPTFPPGFKLGQCSVRSVELGSQPLFQATRVHLRLKVLHLLRGSLVFAMRSQAYEGSLNGEVRLAPFYDVQNYRLVVNWESIQLDNHPANTTLLNRQISGKTSGDFRMKGQLDEFLNGTGVANLRLMEGTCEIDSPYLTTNTLDELEISATIELTGGILEVSQCQFKARGLEGNLNGKVELRPRLSRSTLDLAGEGVIDPAMVNLPPDQLRVAAAFLNQGKPVPFKVRGTIEEPRLGLF